MSTIKANAITSASANNDVVITGDGSGVPDIEASFKVGGTAGVPMASIRTSSGSASSSTFLRGDGTWQTPGGGATALISSITASGAASVDFDGGLSSTYKNYMVIGTDVVPATNNTFLYARFSVDGGSNWDDGASDYEWQTEGKGSGGQDSDDSDFADNQLSLLGNTAYTGLSNATHSNNHFRFFICNPASTATYKVASWATGGIGLATGDEPYSVDGGGYRVATAAIDSVQFFMSSGNINGTFNLYGWKDS